jgi:peptidoglycan/LPS O-acetylase OafA/YrhL
MKPALALWFAAFCVVLIAGIAFSPWHEKSGEMGHCKPAHDATACLYFAILPSFPSGFWRSALRQRNRAAVLSPALFVLAFALLLWRQSDIALVLLFPFLVISLASGAVYLPARLLSTKLAVRLGKLSYSLYFIHTLLYWLVSLIHRGTSARGLGHGHLIGGISALVVAVILAQLSYSLIEVPGHRALRTLFEGKNLAVADEFSPGVKRVV